MRLVPLAVVALAFSSVALACPDEEGAPLERAAQLEKEAQGLLEHGHRAEGARLMAKAWALRAEAWDPGAKSPDGRKVEKAPEAAHRKVAEMEERADALRREVAALKERSADLERAAHELKVAGRGDEAAEKAAAAERTRKAATEAERALAAQGGPRDLAEWRMKVAELKARSEAFEQAAKAAKAAGDEAAAKEKMAASGRAWKEAEALERAGRDHRGPAFPEMRLRRAEIQARVEELEGKLRMIAAGREPGGEARVEELRAKADALRAEVAAIDRKAAGLSDGRPKVARVEEGLGAEVERLRAELHDLRAAVHELSQALRRSLEEKAERK